MSVLWIKDFSGGLNTRFRQSSISDNQFAALRNVRFTRQGALTKRFGSNVITVTGSIGSAFGCYAYALTGMSAEAMIVFGRENPAIVFRTTDGTSFSNVSAGFNTGQSLNLTTQNQVFHFITFGDLVYVFADYADTRSWDNTTWTRIATSTTAFPRTRNAVVFKNRVFAGYINDGAATRRSRLKWSDFGSASAWTATNFEDIYPDDGVVINGLFAFGDELLIFKGPENANQSFMHAKMFRLVGSTFDASNPTYLLDEIAMPPGVGLHSQDAMAIYRGRLIFLTNDGFYEYLGGGIPPRRISETIQGDVNTINVANIDEFDTKAAAFVYVDRYYCAVRSSANSSEGYNNRVYIYDNGQWWMDLVGAGVDSFAIGGGAGFQYTKFLGNIYYAPVTSTVNGNAILRRIEITDQFTENDDNGASYNVNASSLTKEFDVMGQVYFDSCFIHLRRQSSGTLTFEFNIDQRGAVSSSVDMTTPDTGDTATSSSNILRKQIDISRQGRTIQFRFHDRGNNDFEIYAVELHYSLIHDAVRVRQ